MTISKIKVGIVGAGGFGGYRRARLRETGLFELVASYDRNPAAMQAAARDDGAQPSESYEAMLDTPGLEAVVVATGGKYHAEQAIAAAERGLHVFIEKPLCSTAQEVHAILAAGRQHGVVMACGHNDHSSDPASLLIRDRIRSGDLGAIASFEATTAHSGGLNIREGDWRGDPARNPGGMLFQCGVHKLHELMFYFGPLRRVSCMMRYDVHTTGTADVANCLLEFESGLTGTLSAYHVTPARHTLFIFGTKRNLYHDTSPWGSGGLWSQARPDNCDGSPEPVVPVEVPTRSDPCGNVRSFYSAIRTGSPCYPSAVDGARAVLAVLAAEESASRGEIVNITKLEDPAPAQAGETQQAGSPSSRGSGSAEHDR